jgi:opacity protein-like surface antigen
MTKHYLVLVVLAALTVSTSLAHAEGETKEVHKSFNLTALGGVTFYTKVDQNLKYQGTSLATTNSKGKTSPVIGLEGLYRLEQLPLSFGLLGEWSQYKSNSDNDHPDTELGFYALGKAHKEIGSFDLWAGIGLGLVNLSPGETSTVSNGYLIAASSTSYLEFAFTPRFGFDYRISEEISLGLQAAYYSYSGTMDIDATRQSDGTHVRFQDEFSRTWWTTQARVGVRF